MKKKSAVLFISFLLSCSFVSAQSNAKVSSLNNDISASNLQNVEVRWDLNLNNTLISVVASKVSSSYVPKITGATLQGSSKKIIIQYVPELIKREDILQILQGEGITDPYIIEQHQKFYLNNEGFMISAPTKLL